MVRHPQTRTRPALRRDLPCGAMFSYPGSNYVYAKATAGTDVDPETGAQNSVFHRGGTQPVLQIMEEVRS